MRAFKGTVSQLRTVAVTSIQGTASSTRHETSLRFGEHSLHLVTRSAPAIHAGDELRVYGFQFLGSVRPVLVRNAQNGYEAGTVNRLATILVCLITLAALGLGVGMGSGLALAFGLFGLVVSVVSVALRRLAVAALAAT